MIRIALAEDNQRLAETMQAKIELSPDFEVKIVASNGVELLAALSKKHSIDVVVMDIHMPVMDGIEATQKITQRWPNIKVVMSTIFDDEQNLFNAILAGACGYLLKDEEPRRLHRALFEAVEGGMPMSAMIAKKALNLMRSARTIQQINVIENSLTERETSVLEHLAKGLSYEQVGENLFISYGTVRKHVENIYRKLEVNNRTSAIDKAQKSGIL